MRVRRESPEDHDDASGIAYRIVQYSLNLILILPSFLQLLYMTDPSTATAVPVTWTSDEHQQHDSKGCESSSTFAAGSLKLNGMESASSVFCRNCIVCIPLVHAHPSLCSVNGYCPRRRPSSAYSITYPPNFMPRCRPYLKIFYKNKR